jgi:gluconokinase
MGIAGSGKSTVASALASALGFELIEGDAYHPAENVAKMAASIPLTDADRWPWLAALRQAMDAVLRRGGSAVVACSALKCAYRERLLSNDVQLVYLQVSAPVAQTRLAARRGHFFAPALLKSQIETLEEPQEALIVDADQDSAEIIRTLVDRLKGLKRAQEQDCARARVDLPASK